MKTRPFVDTLRDVEFGGLLDELSDIQREVVAAVLQQVKTNCKATGYIMA